MSRNKKCLSALVSLVILVGSFVALSQSAKQNLSEIGGEDQVTTSSAEWNQTYGGTGHDCAYSVVQTSDGGYAMVGRGFSNLAKTDSAGNEEWARLYGGSSWSGVQTVDGGYALAGESDDDFWLVKADSAGDMAWSKTYGGEYNDRSYSVVQTSDGGYAIAGYTEARVYEYLTDFWLVKADVILGYHVTIKAYCNAEGTEVNVWIKMDGVATSYETPHTFADLTYTHTFAVPLIDAHGDHFKRWNTGETNVVITVLPLERTYTAYYEHRPPLGGEGSGCSNLEPPQIADF